MLIALGEFFDSGALHHPLDEHSSSQSDVDMTGSAPAASGSTDGAGEVFCNGTFAFGEDSYRDDVPARSDIAPEPDPTSPS